MGKKYIVEIGRLERLYKAFIGAHGKPEITWLSPEVDLTPYTVSGFEQVRKEAYEKGLSDAWDAARKIYDISQEDRLEIFPEASTFVVADICDRYSASEAIEKIRQYEQEKEEIKVGDEVRNIQHGWTAVVSAIDRECMTLMDTNGKLGDGYDMNRFIKTGRHFPEIAEVLQKMKESDNG